MRLRVILAAVAVAAVFAGTAHAAPRYTALGDSYAAGPLIPLPLPPFGCLKSSNNYGRIAQRTLLYAEYRDATCSGAETELVTINIGGNDIGFSELAENCVSIVPWGSPCKNQYVQNGDDEISDRIDATAPKVAAVIQGIHDLSPDAEVQVLNYSAIFPHTGYGCYPKMPVARGDVVWLRSKQEELNTMLAEQAAANDAELVDVYGASVGRDACASSLTRWVEPYVPLNAAAPLHPNLRGMRAMANLVVGAAG